MSACMWSPGWIVMLVIAIDGPGMSSHHATYDALPELTSCSVPVWMSVLSPTVQPASMQPPPIPIQSDEDSSWPARCAVAVGTVQLPEIELNSLPPCSRVPWLYPNQFVLLLALKRSVWPCDAGLAPAAVAVAGAAQARAAPHARRVRRWMRMRRGLPVRPRSHAVGGRTFRCLHPH